MNRVGRFEKVSYGQWIKAVRDMAPSELDTSAENLRELYDGIKLPRRATTRSAGYDFFAPYAFILPPMHSIVIPTGIRVRIDEDGWFLGAFPKSGLGFKYRAQLDNTIGVIDADYYYSDNEGHILCKLTNDSVDLGKIMRVEHGKGYVQGIFLPFGVTTDDDADGVRNGGFGSTNS